MTKSEILVIQSEGDPDKVFLDNLADGIQEALDKTKRERKVLPPAPKVVAHRSVSRVAQ